jgi:hypothetical protein
MTDEEIAEAQACVDAWSGKRDADGDLVEGPEWDTEDIVRALGQALDTIGILARQLADVLAERERLIVALMDINDIQRDLAEKHIDAYLTRKANKS